MNQEERKRSISESYAEHPIFSKQFEPITLEDEIRQLRDTIRSRDDEIKNLKREIHKLKVFMSEQFDLFRMFNLPSLNKYPFCL